MTVDRTPLRVEVTFTDGRRYPPDGPTYTAVCEVPGYAVARVAWDLRIDVTNRMGRFLAGTACYLADDAPWRELREVGAFSLHEGDLLVAFGRVLP